MKQEPQNVQKRQDIWEEEIRAALREPVDLPSPGFTQRVVGRAREDVVRRRTGIAPLAAAATFALALIAILFFVSDPDLKGASATAQAEAEIRDLLREQKRIERELDDLRRLRAGAAPVVYLAGDEGLEFVYPLAPVLTGNEGMQMGSVRRANY